MCWGLNLWPPFFFNAIRVLHISDDWRSARVVLKKRWYNRNYVKTQFGGKVTSATVEAPCGQGTLHGFLLLICR